MNLIEFDRVLSARQHRMRKVLAAKSAEYSTNADKLHNFRRAADTLGECPEKALIGMAIKHWVSILDIIDKIAESGEYPDENTIDEKIGDMINYLVLLEAMIKEVIRKDVPDNPNIVIGYDAAIKIKDDVVKGICKCKSCRKSASITTENEESGYKHQRVN